MGRRLTRLAALIAAALAACGPAAIADDRELRDFLHYYVDIHEPVFQLVRSGKGGSEMATARSEIHEAAFQMPKPEGTTRIFLVGGSVAQLATSWPGDKRWDQRLAALSGGRRFEVLNVGSRGYDSYRETLVVDEILGYDPDVLVMFSGNNEFHRPVRVDRPRLAAIAMRLRRHAWFRALQDRLAGKMPDPGPADREADFEKNLRKMVRAARGRGAAIVLATLPNNLSDYPPHGEAPWLDADFMAGWEALETARASDAVAYLGRRARLHGGDATTAYYLARAYEAAGRREQALEAYRKAADLSGDEHRCPPSRNETIRRVAREEGALLADLEREFGRVEPLPGGRVFYDGVHWHREFNSFALATVTRAMAAGLRGTPRDPRLDGAAAARWQEEAAGPSFSPEGRREGLLRLLASAGAPLKGGPHASRFSERGVALMDGVEAFSPGTLERLPGLREEAAAWASQAAAFWWGAAPEEAAEEVRSWWPHLLRAGGSALRRRGRTQAARVLLEAAAADLPGDGPTLIELAVARSRAGDRAGALDAVVRAEAADSRADGEGAIGPLAACLRAGTCGLPPVAAGRPRRAGGTGR